MVSALASPISLRTLAISSFVANVLIVASTDLSVLLSIYLNIASAVSLSNAGWLADLFFKEQQYSQHGAYLPNPKNKHPLNGIGLDLAHVFSKVIFNLSKIVFGSQCLKRISHETIYFFTNKSIIAMVAPT
jgi:hypothetical protein